jgi:hypothetical protein
MGCEGIEGEGEAIVEECEESEGKEDAMIGELLSF